MKVSCAQKGVWLPKYSLSIITVFAAGEKNVLYACCLQEEASIENKEFILHTVWLEVSKHLHACMRIHT